MNTFQILFVCTGNICRSPTAERLLRHALQQRAGGHLGPFVVASAGTGALVDEPIQEDAAALLTAHGADVAGFRARQLEEGLVEQADLVLAMTRAHRARAATLAPSVISRMFTLREFARLAAAGAGQLPDGGDPAERARALVKAAASQRGYVRADDPADDDVPDPYGRAAEAYRLPFQLINQAVGTIAPLLVTQPLPAAPGVAPPPVASYRHIVLFRVHAGVSTDAVEHAMAQLRAALEQATGLMSVHVERSLDARKGEVIVEDVTFESRAAYDTFRASVAHRRVTALLSEMSDWTVGDYTVDKARGEA